VSQFEPQSWNAGDIVSMERAKWSAFLDNLNTTGPLGFSHEHDDLSNTTDLNFHNIHMTFAYVLALSALGQDSVSVLDWGGGLGHYYQLGRATLYGVSLDYHCREVPSMAKAGRELCPDVHWYSEDDECLNRSYDLVMVNGSLQYIQNWQEIVSRLAQVTTRYFFLTRVPVVETSPSFVAIQKAYALRLLHQQLNRLEVLQTAEKAGLILLREFLIDDHIQIAGAPEPCSMAGWLFRAPATNAPPS